VEAEKLFQYNHKIIVYLIGEQYKLLMSLQAGIAQFKHSAAIPFLLLHELKDWVKKEKEENLFVTITIKI